MFRIRTKPLKVMQAFPPFEMIILPDHTLIIIFFIFVFHSRTYQLIGLSLMHVTVMYMVQQMI